jgi:hypothetical protein
MGKIEQFNIQLSRPNGIYFTGETIEGVLLIKVSERIAVNSVKIHFDGESYLRW